MYRIRTEMYHLCRISIMTFKMGKIKNRLILHSDLSFRLQGDLRLYADVMH